MSRKPSDMTAAERQELTMYQQRLESSVSTEQEKAEARKKIDELLWQGPGGKVLADISELRDKVERALMNQGGISPEQLQSLKAELIAIAVEDAKAVAIDAAREEAMLTVSAFLGKETQIDKKKIDKKKTDKTTLANDVVQVGREKNDKS